ADVDHEAAISDAPPDLSIERPVISAHFRPGPLGSPALGLLIEGLGDPLGGCFRAPRPRAAPTRRLTADRATVILVFSHAHISALRSFEPHWRRCPGPAQ